MTYSKNTSGTANLTLPNATDGTVGRNTADTLTNKTLTEPLISSVNHPSEYYYFDVTDTLVGKNNNKYIN